MEVCDESVIFIESVKMGTKAVNAINARELHERLHSKQDFSTWIKKRLEVCGAREGADYILIPFDVAQKEVKDLQVAPQKNGAKVKGQELRLFESLAHLYGFKQDKVVHNKKEYIISLEIAKHIAMLEKNDIGRGVRQYFIDYEQSHSDNSIIEVRSLIEITKRQTQALEGMQTNVEIIAKKVHLLESTKRLESWQERGLSDSVKSKVAELTKGRDIGTHIKSAYFRAIYKRLKSKFYVARYSEIPSIKYEEALEYVRNITQDDLVY